MGDPERGLYEKYIVHRRDGRSLVDEKHDGCEYFVLDLTHDRHCVDALRAYAESCQTDFLLLSQDLFKRASELEMRDDWG